MENRNYIVLNDSWGMVQGMIISSLPFDYLYDFLEGQWQKFDSEGDFLSFLQGNLPDAIEFVEDSHVGDYCFDGSY